MTDTSFDYALLQNPEVFQLHRLPPHSDHQWFKNAAEAACGRSSFKKSLNGSWRFHFARTLKNMPRGFEQPDFDVSAWDFIEVPGHFETQGFGRPHYTNKIYPWEGYEKVLPGELPQKRNVVGSYVTFFDKPADWDLRRVFICFAGADSALAVWLNGHFVGYSEDSFTPAYFDLSPYMQEKHNRLCVQVFKYSSGSHLEDQDFWRLSGLFRGVYLYTKPVLHLDDVQISCDLNADFTQAEISCAFQVAEPAAAGSVRAVLSFKGEEVAAAEADVSAGRVNFSLSSPKLWSAEKPNLYQLQLQVCAADGSVSEYIEQQVGVRRFEFIDHVMHLNGRRIVFNGVNRHEFAPRSGRTLTEEEIYQDLLLLKRCNINAVRTSHYPNSSCFYDFCDRLGLYVIDETNMETHGTWEIDGKIVYTEQTIPDGHPQWRQAVLARGEAMLERDKNHPCILIWSCGNESFSGLTIFELAEYFRRHDPSRLVHYEGTFRDRRFDNTSDIESQMYTPAEGVEAYIKAHPDKPFIMCEYTHSMGNSNGGMQRYTELSHREPLYQGGFIWDFCDQAMPVKNCLGQEYLGYGGDFGDRQTDYNFSGNGIFFADRRPTPKLAAVKSNYQNFRLEFVGSLPELKLKISNYFLFTDLSEFVLRVSLMLNGRELEPQSMQLQLPPGESAVFDLPLPAVEVDPQDTLTVDVAICDPLTRPWAEAGFVVAEAQQVVHEMQAPALCTAAAVEMVETVNNIGVHGEGFSYLFSKDKGGLVSLNCRGRELLKRPAQLNFYRAPTDNDQGNRMPFRLGVWKNAGAYALCRSMRGRMENNCAVIEFVHELCTLPRATLQVTYRVDHCGLINVHMHYDRVEGLPDMPEMGLLLSLNGDCSNLKFTGMGPEENYCDRLPGAKIGVFHSTVTEQFVPYLKPQECGNHEHISALRVSDLSGRGLMVLRGADFPAVSVLNWTPAELEQADHACELPPAVKSVVKIARRAMGVGGDDSWGAPVLEPYVNHNETQDFDFCLKVC